MADQSISFQATVPKLEALRKVVLADPAVQSMTGYAGGRGGSNSSFMQIQLKPLGERNVSAEQVINRLRARLQNMPGARMFLVAQQDIRVGGRQTPGALRVHPALRRPAPCCGEWAPKVEAAMRKLPQLVDVNSDSQDKGVQSRLVIDRDRAATRLGVNDGELDAVLNNSFGQRQVSTIFNPLNQYQVVMEVDQQYPQDIESLGHQVEVISDSDGQRVPLSAFTRCRRPPTRRWWVNHQGQFAATTLSFNLAPGVSLGQATAAIDAAVARIGLPSDQIQAGFQGTAAVLQQTLAQHALADPAGAGGGVYRAGHPLRELRAPADHPLDAAVGRAWARCWR